MELPAVLDAFFNALRGLSGEGSPARRRSRLPLVVAFSGGPDSTALLWGLARLGRFDLVAAHLDQGFDPGSLGRAAAAARLAAALGVPLVTARRPVRPAVARPGGRPGLEAAARRARYEFLEEVRARRGAPWVVTGHTLDDQAETVLLRLLFGSGLLGLAGMRPVAGKVVRPLLAVPRNALAAALGAAGLQAVDDPTNRDLRRPRNLIRHRLLPALAGVPAATPSPASGSPATAELAARLARLAGRAAGAADGLDRRLVRQLDLRRGPAGWGLDLDRLRALPRHLWPAALAALHRRAGADYPPPRRAVAELAGQFDRARGSLADRPAMACRHFPEVARLGRVRAIGCDCGSGWRWVASGGRLELRREREKRPLPHFTYTLRVPGELDLPELGLRLRLARGPVEPWMFRGEPRRAGLALPLDEGACVTVRSRLPGDRLHPLGARGGRRLKEVLIDRRVPRAERELLPLVCVGSRIAWVPGVTIDQRYRILRNARVPAHAGHEAGGEPSVWVAELTPGNPRPQGPVLERKGCRVPSRYEVAEL